MFGLTQNGGLQQTTSYKVVLPFYIYAAISFVIATALLLLRVELFHQHYFYPHTLAVTHIMTLGWGVMIILGASHQLLPVLIEGKLFSDSLAYATFFCCALGIPFLVASFYVFNVGWAMQTGAILINIGAALYFANVLGSIIGSKKFNVHAWFIVAASMWLFVAVFLGALLVFNFSRPILPEGSLSYLSVHAHIGLAGWFLLLIIGVGSRLIPMFLISKYVNNKTLWQIFALVNIGLVGFLFIKFLDLGENYYYFSIVCGLAAAGLFGRHCFNAYKTRIRKAVDAQMKISLLSVAQILIPLLILILSLIITPANDYPRLALLYGFSILFGWITAIILGMTFKTLPFIVWNKVYHKKAYAGKTPAPKELFGEKIYNGMSIAYISGFILTAAGVILLNDIVLKAGAAALFASAVLYAINTGKVLLHQPIKIKNGNND